MDFLDIAKHIRPSLCASLVSAAIDTLSFQYSEDSFSGGVVHEATNSTHTGDHVMSSQEAQAVTDCGLSEPPISRNSFLGVCPRQSLWNQNVAGGLRSAACEMQQQGRGLIQDRNLRRQRFCQAIDLQNSRSLQNVRAQKLSYLS